MTLNIGRKGFTGIGLQTGFQVPATIADYAEFTVNTLTGMQDQLPVDSATGLRDKVSNTVPGTAWSEGEIDLYADNKNAGYFFVSALGSVQTFSLGSGVFRHVITRNNSNQPQYLTLTNDRAIEQELYADVCVDTLTLSVGLDIVTVKNKLIGNFPQTTASGVKTTTSGNVFNFAGAQFAFGTTISGAQSNTPLKPHDFNLNISNNASAVFGQSMNTPRSINYGDFEATCDFTLYFETLTDRNTYYTQAKQAASFELYGNGIGGGFLESLVANMYKTSVKSFAIDTGIDNYFAEKVTLTLELDASTGRTLDTVITNTKTLYI